MPLDKQQLMKHLSESVNAPVSVEQYIAHLERLKADLAKLLEADKAKLADVRKQYRDALVQRALARASKLPKAPSVDSQAIKQVEQMEQDIKKSTGVDKIEKEVERAVNAAAHTLSKALMIKLQRGEKLTTQEQVQVAAVAEEAGLL